MPFGLWMSGSTNMEVGLRVWLRAACLRSFAVCVERKVVQLICEVNGSSHLVCVARGAGAISC